MTCKKLKKQSKKRRKDLCKMTESNAGYEPAQLVCPKQCRKTKASGMVDCTKFRNYEEMKLKIHCYSTCKFFEPVTLMDEGSGHYKTVLDNIINTNYPLTCADTSKLTTLHQAFANQNSFNQDLQCWDTSKVTDMTEMFVNASTFNGDVSTWDTSKVMDMSRMFEGAASFNHDIASWESSNLSKMDRMFYNAAEFDQNLCSWDLSNLEPHHNSVFYGTSCKFTDKKIDHGIYACHKC